MKIIKTISLITFLVLISQQLIEAQVFEWAIGYSNEVEVRGISTDADGNSYLTGIFYGTATFGTETLTSFGSQDIFLAKFDDGGGCLWVKQAGGTQTDYGNAISIDADGNSFLTGYFNGTATFGTISLTSYGEMDIFIAKYDNAGNCLWAQKAGGVSSWQTGFGIAVDGSSNSYVTGSFRGTATFGTTTLTSYGVDDIFTAKYDTDGNCLWAQQAGGTSVDIGLSIIVDASGSYVVGQFMGTATFGTTTLTSNGSRDIFTAKYDTDGNCLWAQQAGGEGEDVGKAISRDASGNSYITGWFSGTATFGTTTLTSNGSRDIFTAKYDTDGNCLWVNQGGGPDYAGWSDEARGISTDANGNSYITGFFATTGTYGTKTLTCNAGRLGIYIVKCNNSGNFLWAQTVGGSCDDVGFGISASTNDHIYVIGTNGCSANFGNVNLISGGSFLTKVALSSLTITSPNGNENWRTNSQHNITWNSVDDGNIKIEITTNNGANWLTLQNSIVASLGNYTLTVPPFSTSSDCKIRLTSLSYGNVSSSNAFTITSASVPNLTVSSPNTSLIWNAGSSQNITWILSGSVENVKLEYTTNNGTSWNTITNSTSAIAQSYTWVVPNTPSTSCRIRVSDATNSVLNDISDALFKIASIVITSPINEDKWKAGISRNITWTSTGVDNVNLFYSTNNGADWTQITSNQNASNGSYSWNVPNITSPECKIKIADASDATLYNISYVFSIWKPIVSTQTPPTGQNTQNFGLTNIDFSVAY